MQDEKKICEMYEILVKIPQISTHTTIWRKEKVDDRSTNGIKILSNGVVLLNSNVSLSELQCAINYNTTFIR